MSFIEVAKLGDISEGQMKSFTIGNKEILVANCGGRYFATDGGCTHMGSELAKGKLDGKIITCPKHGARFDVTTGGCISGPKIGFIKLKTKDLPCHEIEIEDQKIKVNL